MYKQTMYGEKKNVRIIFILKFMKKKLIKVHIRAMKKKFI